MRTALRPLVVLALAALALVGGTAVAQAATTLVYQEVTTSVVFIPSSGPDPRGAGSVIISKGDLLQNGTKVGTIDLTCTTTRKVGADYYGYCEETLTVPGGALFARGEINESALERFEPQTLAIYAGGGIYGGRIGTLKIQQTTYPDKFTLTAVLT